MGNWNNEPPFIAPVHSLATLLPTTTTFQLYFSPSTINHKNTMIFLLCKIWYNHVNSKLDEGWCSRHSRHFQRWDFFSALVWNHKLPNFYLKLEVITLKYQLFKKIPTNSISNHNVAFLGMTFPAPLSPYASDGGIRNRLFPPTVMPSTPISHPSMTSPAPILNWNALFLDWSKL